MNRILSILLALSIGANIGLVARTMRAPSAPGPGAPPAGAPKPEFDRLLRNHVDVMTERLELSDRQRNAVVEAHSSLFPPILDTHHRIEQLRDAAARAFADEVTRPEEFRARMRELQASQNELDSLLTEVLFAEVAVLDESQRERYVRDNPWSRRLEAPLRDGGPRRGDGPRPGRRPPPGEGPPPPR